MQKVAFKNIKYNEMFVIVVEKLNVTDVTINDYEGLVFIPTHHQIATKSMGVP